jgi:hypothetical protein
MNLLMRVVLVWATVEGDYRRWNGSEALTHKKLCNFDRICPVSFFLATVYVTDVSIYEQHE